MGTRKEKDDTYLRKKAEEKQNSVIIMISVLGKSTVFPVKLKLKEKSFRQRYWKSEFWKRSNEFNWDKLQD